MPDNRVTRFDNLVRPLRDERARDLRKNPLRIHRPPARSRVRIETTGSRWPSTTAVGNRILRSHGGMLGSSSADSSEASFDSATTAKRAALAVRKEGYWVVAYQPQRGGGAKNLLKPNPRKRRRRSRR